MREWGIRRSSREVIVSGGADTRTEAAVFCLARDAAVALIPGTYSLLSHVDIVPDDALPEGLAALFHIEVAPGVSADAVPMSALRGVMRVRESTARVLAALASGRPLPHGEDRFQVMAEARKAAVTVLHELMHSLTVLDFVDVAEDWAAVQRDTAAMLFLEAATHAAAEQYVDSWIRACGFNARLPIDTATVAPKATAMIGDQLEVRIVAYEPLRIYTDALLDAASAGSDVMRTLLLEDLVAGRHATAMDRLAEGLLEARSTSTAPSSIAALATQIRSGLVTVAEAFDEIRRAALEDVAGVWSQIPAAPQRARLRRVATPCVLDTAVADAVQCRAAPVVDAAVRRTLG